MWPSAPTRAQRRFHATVVFAVLLSLFMSPMQPGRVSVAEAACDPPPATCALAVESATPSGANQSLASKIRVTFNQAINPATFAGSINGAALVATQIVVAPAGTVVDVDPGELEYGRNYSVTVNGTVAAAVGGGTLGAPHTFNFTVGANPGSKRPSTTVTLPTGTLQTDQTYTITGTASGYVWQRDAANPLELRRWNAAGADTGAMPMLHPTALYFPTAVDGYKYWLYYTPYPGDADENPVLMRSNDGVTFTAAGIVKQPMFAYGFQPPFDSNNLADPEVYRVGDTWMMFYEMETGDLRGAWMRGGGYIGVAFSTDGLNWTPYGGAYPSNNNPSSFPANGNPVMVPQAGVAGESGAIAKFGEPVVLFKDGLYHMWRTVFDRNTSNETGFARVAYATASDPRGPWTKQGVAIDYGDWGIGPNTDVVYDPERALYLMSFLQPNGSGAGLLGMRTAASPAGPWTPHPLNPTFPAQLPWEGDTLYRASMVRVDGQLYYYYSGNALEPTGQIGLAREVPGVRQVEVSTDGGATWQAVTVNPDRTWSFAWTPTTAGTHAITARVTDDFMRGADAPPQNATVTAPGSTCPCSIWAPTATPATANENDSQAVEVGVKFRSSVAGTVSALRFYKGNLNTGTHTASLWTAGGTLLGRATFTGETASGWQQVSLPTPVTIAANTTYIASYHAPVGRYSTTGGYFAAATTRGPLTALANATESPGNGLYRYTSTPAVPNAAYDSANYWVDVVFHDVADTTPPTISAVSASGITTTAATIGWTTNEAADTQVEYGPTTSYGASTTLDTGMVTAHSQAIAGLTANTLYHYRVKSRDGAGNLATSADFTFTTAATDTTAPVLSAVAAGSITTTGATITWTTNEPADTQVDYGPTTSYGSTTTLNPAMLTSHSQALTGLTANTLYHYRVKSRDGAGNLATSGDFTFTTTAAGGCPCSIWAPTATPATANENDTTAVEVGVKFRSNQAGTITGLRFYKGNLNTGTHVGSLWSNTGTLLGRATFTGETASGWQQVSLPTPVTIAANTTYIASYHAPVGRYSTTGGYFAAATTNGPLTALANGTESPGNGLYRYTGSPAVPNGSYNSENYWVDVVFSTAGADTTPPTISAVSASGITTTAATIGWTTNEASDTQVDYGLTTSYGSTTTLNPAMLTSHSQGLTGLSPGTLYHYRVKSRDAVGNLATSGDFTFTTAAPDTTAPTFSNVQASGMTTVAATIAWTTNEASDTQVEYGPTTSYGSSTTLDTALVTSHSQGLTGLSPGQLYHYRVKSRDAAGNLGTSGDFTFTTQSCPCQLWSDATTPAIASQTDTSAVEVGVKFRSDVSGFVRGLRFYKGATNTGTHIGNLWSSTGTLLASGVFVNETATGWQTLTFPSPVAIAADTTYVASYFAPNGGYAIDYSYFTGAFRNAPLTALADGADGPNGLYRYTATSAFPNATSTSSNYWVDVVFDTSSTDTTPPAISGVQATPVASTSATIGWTTNEASDTQVEYGLTTSYGSTTTLNPAMLTSHSQALTGLSPSTLYHYRVKSRDAAGNLATSGDSTFTTAAPDTTAPTISAVQAGSITSTGATITWTTDEASDTQVDYGPTTSYGSSTTLNPAMLTSHSQALTGLTASTLYHYRVKSRDGAGNLATTADFTFTTAAPADTTAPVISAVAAGSITTAGATITWTTNEASDTQVEYGPTTSYGSSTTLDTALVTSHSQGLTGLTPGQLYHYRVKSRDAAGNLGTSADFTFTTQGCPCSVWSDTATPGIASQADAGAIEVGARFRSSVGGYILGLRFYKGPANTGTHVGNLWTDAGTNLATATFTGESATGWQTVTFPSPVAILANTTYVASYFAPAGGYAIDETFFGSAGVTNGPLTAPQSQTGALNGVYRAGAGGFPTANFNNSNYWVDVVFHTQPVDPTPPAIASVQATNVANASATITWGTNEPADGQVEYGPTTAYGFQTPLNPALVGGHAQQLTGLVPGQLYHYRVKSRDAAGNLTTSGDFAFTTVGLEAPRAPILVLNQPGATTNPYSAYLGEILRSEGLVQFQRAELAGVAADPNRDAYLAAFPVVLLAEAGVSASEGQLLRTYVSGGGSLIAMRPDPALADLFGLSYVGARPEQPLQFLAVHTGGGQPGAGIYGQSLQYHGAADNYTLAGATSLGDLWNSISTPSANPAVTLHAYGAGTAAAFTFDLAKSLVLMRQGNPAWQNSDGDGVAEQWPMDMFARTDGRRWVAPERIPVPQADEEQRFLANLIYHVAGQPLPRMWYLPNKHKVVLVSTGDTEDLTAATEIARPMDAAESYGARYSHYMRTAGIANVAPATEASWRARGHETGVHVIGDTETYPSLFSAFQDITQFFQSRFGHLPRTTRNHTLDWVGWSEMAEIEAAFGTRMDTNYYQYLPWMMAVPFAQRHGYLTGSALPQRFADETGAVLPIYQVLTEFADEWYLNQGYTLAEANLAVRSQIEAALANGYYAAFVNNVHHPHFNNPNTYIESWARTMWQYGQQNGIPMWSTEMLLDFVEARNAAAFANMSWNGTTLTFTFTTPTAGQSLTLMVPAAALGGPLQALSVGGSPASYSTETVKGRSYALFVVTAATAQVVAQYGADTTPPVVGAVQTPSVLDTRATVTWTTDEGADTLIQYGPTTAYGSSTPLDPALVTAHTQQITGLTPSTLYHYRVRSRDAVGNTTFSGDFTFTTLPDGTPPTISAVQAVPASSTAATITWTTDEGADSQVEYGPTAGYGATTALDPTAVTSHAQTLTGLVAGTLYHFRVKSRDPAGNLTNSADFTFTITDATPPLVSAVQAGSITSTGATITWTTDEPADTQVDYGPTTSYGSSTTLNPTMLTSHSQALAGLAASTLYHYRVKSRDAAGNLATSGDFTFTTAAASASSIWSPSTTPAVANQTDTRSIEVGVKFRSSVAGTITGIRFYKGPLNTSAHTVSLYSRTGTLLGRVAVTGETASGWQQMNFATPIAINANTTYVASYHSPGGRYAIDSGFFTGNAVTNGPLTALASGTDGPNGVYRYTNNPAFPNQTFNASNYWVDVAFQAGP